MSASIVNDFNIVISLSGFAPSLWRLFGSHRATLPQALASATLELTVGKSPRGSIGP